MFGKAIIRGMLVVTVVCSTIVAQAVTIETVPVGDPGNTGEWSGESYGGDGPDRFCGAVDYVYNIGKYEVTNSQYAEFLNAVADADPNGLYDTQMTDGWNDIGGITRSGSDGSYNYTVRANRGDRPVNYIDWYDTLRFANWLHNGQPVGPQDSNTTEDGAYQMSLGSKVVRKSGALVFLPSEDEWYKAAYYKGGGTNEGYWDYATASNVAPTAELPAGTDMINGSANYYVGGPCLDTTYWTTEVGAYGTKPSDSAYGTFDQGGNVWEWNEADILGDGSYRGLRGGSFGTYIERLRASARSYTIVPPDAWDQYHFGFRVASIPEPGSLIMLAGIALMALLYWWPKRA